jgi:hypothetical protein
MMSFSEQVVFEHIAHVDYIEERVRQEVVGEPNNVGARSDRAPAASRTHQRPTT